MWLIQYLTILHLTRKLSGISPVSPYIIFVYVHLFKDVECKKRYRVPRRDTADQIMMPAQMSNQVEKRRPQCVVLQFIFKAPL